MKLFYCKLGNGELCKMTLNKVIKRKKEGKPVKIIKVAEVIEKNK